MASKIKNIIIFVIIAAVLIFIYVFFFKKAPEEAGLVSSSGNAVLPSTSVSDQNSTIGKDFLSILLNVKNIKLDDSIFSDPVFASLHDSSIELISDGNEGRPNPFAPLGSDIIATPVNALDISIPVNALDINIPTIPATPPEQNPTEQNPTTE